MRSNTLMFIAACGVAFTSNVADAADLPVKAAAPIAAIPIIYNWSGWSIGANLGYGHSDADWTNRESDPAATFFDELPGAAFTGSLSGVIGGVQIGYDYQLGRWVYGVEAMFNASAIKDSWTSRSGAADDQFEAQIHALILGTARLGYAWDNFLAYGKAGVAFANVKVSVTDTIGPTTGAGSDSNWRLGPTVGFGIEYGMTPRLSLAVEYDFIHLNSGSYQTGGGAGTYVWDVDIGNVSQIIGKLKYRLN